MGGTPRSPAPEVPRRTLSPRAAWACGLVLALAGAGPIAAAILADDARLSAPRWVVAAAGWAFLVGAAAVVKGFGIDRGVTRPYDPWSPLCGALLATCLAAISAWVAFGSGQRRFQISGPLPLQWLPPGTAEWLGRAAFGMGAVLTGTMALVFWGQMLWRLWRRPARDAMAPGLALVAIVVAGLAELHVSGDLRLWPATRALQRALAAPGLTDADRLQRVLEAKLANPAYIRWQQLPWYQQPFQAFEEEALLKAIRSRIAATVTPPAGAGVTTIPLVAASRPVIDGRLEPDEWTGAARLDLGHGTQLALRSDGQRLYLGCDVPADTTADGFDQLRFYYHVNLAEGIRHERIHVGRSATDPFDSYRLVHVERPGARAPFDITEGHIYQGGRGASTMVAHRQFEAMLDLHESGLHRGAPFAAYVEVETDPISDSSGRFVRRAYAGALGSQAEPIWLMIGPRQVR